MNEISTVNDIFNKYAELYTFEEDPSEYLINKEDFMEALLEFAKIHVQAALEAAANNAIVKVHTESWGDYETSYNVDTKSILTAYPLNSIK